MLVSLSLGEVPADSKRSGYDTIRTVLAKQSRAGCLPIPESHSATEAHCILAVDLKLPANENTHRRSLGKPRCPRLTHAEGGSHQPSFTFPQATHPPCAPRLCESSNFNTKTLPVGTHHRCRRFTTRWPSRKPCLQGKCLLRCLAPEGNVGGQNKATHANPGYGLLLG